MMETEEKEEKDKNFEFKEAFNFFDKDCDGFITTKELEIVMRSLGHNPTKEEIDEVLKHLQEANIKEEIDELIKLYDKDESGTIDLDEFIDLMNNKLKEQQEEQELLESFQLFDRDGDGLISVEDLKYVFKAIGEKLEEELINQLKQQGCVDQDGNITYQEFVRIMTDK